MPRRAAATLALAMLTCGAVAHAEPKACTDALEEGKKLAASGKLVAARDRLAACAAATCPANVRSDCTKKRDEVEGALPTVSFVVRDASGADVQAAIRLDGAPLATDGRAQALDPGQHVVWFQRPGRAAHEQSVTIHEGEKSRVVVLTSADDTVDAPAEPAVDGSELEQARAAARAAADAPPALTPGKPPEKRSPLPWVLVGVGGVSLAVGGAFMLVSLSDRSSADDLDALAERQDGAAEKAATQRSAESKRDAAESNQTLGLVIGGAGAGLLAVGLVWVIARGGGGDAAPASARVTPLVGRGLAGAAVGGRF